MFDKKINRELQEKINKEERKNVLRDQQDQKYESYLESAVIFFGTLAPLYILFPWLTEFSDFHLV